MLEIPVEVRERCFPNSSSDGPRSRPQRLPAIPRSGDPDVISARLRHNRACTVNINPIPEGIRELVIQEFAQGLGLFPRHEYPNQEEVLVD